MTNIEAKARNVRELLGGKKYAIDYFQREYRWRTKEIGELITDLTARFLSAWKPTHLREAVAKYPAYFLGSIIVSGDSSRASVIDGQQRLTSLSIILIWVLHGLKVEEDRKQIADLIFTRQFGSNSYNLDVPERASAMEALYKKQDFNRDDAPESVRNILDRYDDINEMMPKDISVDARAMFADWLIEKVYLVEIKTPTDNDGYAIFETMNDRGLPLSPTDMLKSHLLANAGSDEVRKRLNGIWKARIDQLMQIEKEADADAIKNWLRAKHANSIRERQAGSTPEDFERIGTEFHRWVRDAGSRLNLRASEDFVRVVERDFEFYTNWYMRLYGAANTLTLGREALYCNNLANFTLQYPLILAAIQVTDADELSWKKAQAVSSFVDILVARRTWHGRSIDYNTMQYAMFLAIKDIRDKPLGEIANLLLKRIEDDTGPFTPRQRFGLWETNKKTARRFLARLAAWLDREVGIGETLSSYLVSSGAQRYDIEHVVPDQFAAHKTGYANEDEFQEYRNRIGALLLLPRAFNRSYGALPYTEKREHYLTQNVLAQTLHEQAYQHNPQLKRIINEVGIPFKAHPAYEKEDIEARHEIYVQIAEQIWSVDRLKKLAIQA